MAPTSRAGWPARRAPAPARARRIASSGVATVAHPRLDSAEYRALQAAAGWRSAVELIGGEAVVTPPSGGQAASAHGELFYVVRRWQEATGDGGLLLQDMFIRLSNEDYLAPDLAWWAATRRPTLVRGALDIVPDLVAEVLSPATRSDDLGAKKDAYLAAGARELWLADPQAATITAIQPDGGQHTVGRGDPLTSPLLRGFAVDVARVFLAWLDPSRARRSGSGQRGDIRTVRRRPRRAVIAGPFSSYST